MVFTMCTQRTQVETPTEFEHLRGMENHDLGAPKVNKNQYLEVKIGDKNNKLQRNLTMWAKRSPDSPPVKKKRGII